MTDAQDRLRTARDAEQTAFDAWQEALDGILAADNDGTKTDIAVKAAADHRAARRATDEALVAAVIERCAERIEDGSFLHDDAPDARLSRAAAKALRLLDPAALLAAMRTEET